MAVLKVAKVVLGLIFLGVVGSVLSQETPADFTPEKIAEMFPVVADKEYEIIPIHKSRLQKRGINGGFHLQLKAFGQNIKLWLNPNEGTLASYDTPVWTLHKNNELVRYPNIMKEVIPLMYHDRRSSATLFINEVQQGIVQLFGTIGNNQYYIQPVSNNGYQRYPRSADNNTKTFADHSYHIIYKMGNGLQYLNNLQNPLQKLFRTQGNQNSPVDTVYPEIMVVLDYPFFYKLNQSISDAVKYTLTFFNGVDLKYRAFENPKYRLNIAGLIITAEQGALPYMNHVSPYKPNYLNADTALQVAAEWMAWLGGVIGHNTFDASITLTPLPLCTNKGNVCTPGSIGYANIGLNCEPFNHYNKLYRRNSGVVHDNVDFEGIRTTAHELGHLFGVNHDGDNPKNRNCNSNQGHIMTPSVKFTDNGSEWSYCSMKEFEEFLNSKNPTCLFNKPKKSAQEISRFLPGQWLDANLQCFHWVGTRAWEINERICQRLLCVNPKNPRTYSVEFEAAEGTRCGPNSICLHNNCVPISQIQ